MRRLPLVLALAASWSAAGSAQDSFSVLGGTQFTAGSYGGDRTVSTASVSVGVMATVGRWRWWATVPFVFQDAATVRTIGAGMLPVGGATHTQPTGSSGGMMGGAGPAGMNDGGSSMTGHAGAGDPLLRVDATVWGSATATGSVALYGAVKAPLASAVSGFGTGQWDQAAGASFARHLNGVSILADAAFWHIGRAPGDPYRNVATGALSVARALERAGQHLYGSLLATTPFVQGSQGPVQLAAGWSRRDASRRVLSVTAGVGLTPTAPAVTLGAGWQWGLR